MEEILQSLPDPMKLNQSVWFIVVLVLVLLVILNKFVFKPVVLVLDEREEKIRDGIQIRKSSLKTVEESQQAYKHRLTEARKDSYIKRVQILKQSQDSFDQLMISAKKDAAGSMQVSLSEIEERVTLAKQQLRDESEKIAEQIYNAVLNKKSVS